MKKKRILSLVMSAAMVAAMFPATAIPAFAAPPAESVSTEAELRAAITAGSDVSLNGDITVNSDIAVPAAYAGTIDGGGHTLTLGAAAAGMFDLSGTADVTVSNVTIDGANLGRAFYMDAAPKLTLGDTTVKNCTGPSTSADGMGGAIAAYGGSHIVLNSGTLFENNYTTVDGANGGAIYASRSAVEVHGATFTGNHCATLSYGNEGGAVWCQGTGATFTMDSGTFNIGKPFQNGGGVYCRDADGCTITGGTFDINGLGDAYCVSGGAIMISGTTPVSISNATFTAENGVSKAAFGGGFINVAPGASGTGGNIEIKNSTFTSTTGSSLATYGGAIVFETGASNTVLIDGCTFTGCASDKTGGAISFATKPGDSASVNATVSNCTITDCATWHWGDQRGGGIHVGAGNTVAVNKTTITAPSLWGASGYGGGIYNAGTTTIENSKLNNNMSYYNGGAIYNAGTMTINGTDTEIKNNASGDGFQVCYGGGIYNNGTLTVNAGTFSGNLTRQKASMIEAGKTNEYFGNNIYCNESVTIAPAASFDAKDIRVLDGKSHITLSGVPMGNINVSISENAATTETAYRKAGYLIADGAGATSAALAKVFYLSKDATVSTTDNSVVGKWVFVRNPSGEIVVGQHATMIYDPNEENTAGAAFAAGTAGLDAATKNVGQIVDIYSESNPAVTKISDQPAASGYAFKDWYDTAMTAEAAASATAHDFSTSTFIKAADLTNGELTTILSDPTMTVYAGYTKTITTYTMTYVFKDGTEVPAGATKPADGTVNDGDTVTAGAASTTTATANAAGVSGTWTFGGWTATSGVTNGKATGNVVFTGEWTFAPNAYTVTYVFKDGTEVPAGATKPADGTVNDGDTVTAGAASTTTATANAAGVSGTWTFGGWTATSGVTNGKATGNVVFTGEWTFAPNAYTVTYVFKDGTEVPAGATKPADGTVNDGDTVTAGAASTTTATTNAAGVSGTWTFGGWTVTSGVTNGKATGNVVFTGEWTFAPNAYTVTYVFKDGTEVPAGATKPADGTVNDGDTVTAGAASTTTATANAAGVSGAWTFGGWTATSGVTNGKATGNVVFTGEWTFVPLTYTLTYDGNGSTSGTVPVDAKSPYIANSEVTVLGNTNNLAKTDYTFQGWAKTAGAASADYTASAIAAGTAKFNITGNTTLYAVWTYNGGGDIIVPTTPEFFTSDHIAYLYGFPDDTIRPGADMTRAQAAVVIYRLLSDETRAANKTTVCAYPDVTDGSWYETAVATLSGMGIIRGFPDGTFKPDASITRAQFAAMFARFDSSSYSGTDKFSDISGHWAANLIDRAAVKGWVEGFPDGTFRPDENITRAQAATLINRVLVRLPESVSDLVTKDMKSFADNSNADAWYYLALQEAINTHTYTLKNDKTHETWKAVLSVNELFETVE